MNDLDIPGYTDPIHKPMTPYTLVLEPGLKVYKIGHLRNATSAIDA